MKIKEMPTSERPYEKLEMYGAKSLSNAELLAIVIKNGTKEITSIELAQKIIKLIEENNQNCFRALQELSIEEFMQIKGIGKVKAIQLKATFEIAKRMARPVDKINVKIKNADDVAKLLMEEMRYEKREYVKVLILNNKNKILKIRDISIGTTSYAVIEPKDVIIDAIKMGAPKIILVHNHPSGDSTPSKEDFEITEKLIILSEGLGIQLLDHIVIGDGNYSSILLKIMEKNN